MLLLRRRRSRRKMRWCPTHLHAANHEVNALLLLLQVKERKERKKEDKLAEVRDFLETSAELDAASIEAVVVAGHVGSMDALVMRV